MQLRVLCIGDIVGKPGRYMLAEYLPGMIRDHQIDCVIANAENAAGGSGLTEQIYKKLLHYGVSMITLGDHAYRKRDIIPVLETSDRICRPANLARQAAGKEWISFTTAKGERIAVFCLLGRTYMSTPTDNPFHTAERILGEIPSDIKHVFVEIHAEATSEKVALGWHLNGRVSAVFGTHTHVPTADETILDQGTAYISDLGMTGPHRSVLGRNIEPVLKSLITQMPYSYSIATEDLRLNGILVTIEEVGPHTGRAIQIERICLKDHRSIEQRSENQAYDADDGKPQSNASD